MSDGFLNEREAAAVASLIPSEQASSVEYWYIPEPSAPVRPSNNEGEGTPAKVEKLIDVSSDEEVKKDVKTEAEEYADFCKDDRGRRMQAYEQYMYAHHTTQVGLQQRREYLQRQRKEENIYMADPEYAHKEKERKKLEDALRGVESDEEEFGSYFPSDEDVPKGWKVQKSSRGDRRTGSSSWRSNITSNAPVGTPAVPQQVPARSEVDESSPPTAPIQTPRRPYIRYDEADLLRIWRELPEKLLQQENLGLHFCRKMEDQSSEPVTNLKRKWALAARLRMSREPLIVVGWVRSRATVAVAPAPAVPASAATSVPPTNRNIVFRIRRARQVGDTRQYSNAQLAQMNINADIVNGEWQMPRTMVVASNKPMLGSAMKKIENMVSRAKMGLPDLETENVVVCLYPDTGSAATINSWKSRSSQILICSPGDAIDLLDDGIVQVFMFNLKGRDWENTKLLIGLLCTQSTAVNISVTVIVDWEDQRMEQMIRSLLAGLGATVIG